MCDARAHAAKSKAQRGRFLKMHSDDDSEEDEPDGEEAASQWAHAELMKHLKGVQKLEMHVKRARVEATASEHEISKPPMLLLEGLPHSDSETALNSGTKLKEKFPDIDEGFPIYTGGFYGRSVLVFVSRGDEMESAFAQAKRV
jgi:hypothetical protein